MSLDKEYKYKVVTYGEDGNIRTTGYMDLVSDASRLYEHEKKTIREDEYIVLFQLENKSYKEIKRTGIIKQRKKSSVKEPA